jgi:multidrug efflux pump
VPGGFIPTQDKQYLFGVVALPEGASIDRTQAVVEDFTARALAVDGVANVVAFPGLNGVHFAATPSAAVLFIGLDDFESRFPGPIDRLFGARTRNASDIWLEVIGSASQIKEGLAFAFLPPPVLGLGNAAGFEMYVQDRANLGYGELNNQVQGLAGALRADPGFDPQSVISTFQSNVPQLDAVVDRTKAKQQNVPLTEIYDALQVYLGSAYVNDFNLFGKTYAVYAQADAAFRDRIDDIRNLKTRNAMGEMVPLGSVVDVREAYGPDPVVRYNGYPAADLQGGVNAAVMSSNEALVAAADKARQMLPVGMTFEWTGLTYQQVTQGSAALWVFPLCVLLVFLVLAALYESWSLPLAVILIVPMALLAAMGGLFLINFLHGMSFIIWPPTAPPTFLDNNLFTQIGLVVLMGLACKNAILIVEFARELEMQGRSIVEAAIEASRLRLRPILMTSFAFIMGVVPLVFASGAGAEVRYVMGVTVFCGMLGVTVFGLFLTPTFYVVIRTLVARRQARAARHGGTRHA